MGLLDGKVAIVTGAGRGIGRGEALLLASYGARVVVNDLGGAADGSGAESTPAQQVVDEIKAAGGEAIANDDDVADFDAAKRLIGSAVETWGTLDILVCNAGILRDKMIFNMDESDWDSVMRVHLKGHFAPTRHACVYWRNKSKETGGAVNGRIIMTSSTSGIYGNPGQSNYGAAKAGIASFAQIVSMEMRKYGVTVNAISPGAFTRMTEFMFAGIDPEVAEKQWSPDHIAPVVGFLASDQAAYITGQLIYVGGGFVRTHNSWSYDQEAQKDGVWTVEELLETMPKLFAGRDTIYSPPKSQLRLDVAENK